MVDPQDLANLLAHGMDEMLVRVSQYANGKPTAWQGLVKFSNRTKPWGVGVADTPEEAMKIAVTKAIERNNVQAPTAQVRVRVRNRQN